MVIKNDRIPFRAQIYWTGQFGTTFKMPGLIQKQRIQRNIFYVVKENKTLLKSWAIELSA